MGAPRWETACLTAQFGCGAIQVARIPGVNLLKQLRWIPDKIGISH